MEPRIIEAVGLARAPGSSNLRKDVRRAVRRRLLYLLMKSKLPRPAKEKLADIIAKNHHNPWFWLFAGASISNTTENSIQLLIFNATAWANFADNAASSPRTNIYVCLHTADPGEAGTGATSECAYTSYLRVAVARSGSGWTVTNNSVSPAANIDFPQATGGTETATHFSCVSATATTAGVASAILFSGTITPNISISSGVTPRLTTATTITLD